MDGIPPERVVTDSWPALHGRPVLRRTVAVGLVLCVSAGAALVVRGVNALTVGRVGRETDRDRAERLAGLHPSQHPGAGRYYVPVGAVYTRTSDGSPVAYLHYRLGGGKEPGLGDFLRTYDLPAPGPAAPLPPDLAAALGGDEPAEAPELPEGADGAVVAPSPSPSASASASASVPEPGATAGPTVAPTTGPTVAPPAGPMAIAAEPTPTDPDPDPDASGGGAPDGAPDGGADASADAGTDAGSGGAGGTAHVPEDGTPDPSPTPTWTPTASPSAVPTRVPSARRIYVAAIPGGLPGAADIYIRATG